MTDRTETCTPAERAFLDALYAQERDFLYQPQGSEKQTQWSCPFCDYEALGPASDAIARSFTQMMQDRLGESFRPNSWAKGRCS